MTSNDDTLLPIFKVVANEKYAPNLLKNNISQINCTCRASGSAPIHYAMLGGNKNTVNFLLNNGAWVNSQNYFSETALHWACKIGKISLIKLLLKHGICMSMQDTEGNTALHWAADFDNPEVVKFLLENGADPTIKNKRNETPFHIALASGYQEQMKLLNPQRRGGR